MTTFTYDAAGNLTSETDPLGNVTAYQYDNLYRIKKLIEPDPDGGGGATSPETLFAHDAVGNRTSLTDPIGNETTWTYDNLDRTISETNDLSDVRTFEYDAASNLVKKTDRNGRVTEYDYDNLHRRTAELWKNGGSTVRTIGYAYDAASQLTEATDPAAAYDYVYDNLGRATEVASDTSALDVVLTQEFNATGWRTALGAEVNSTGDLEDRFFYDNLGRMTKIERDSAPEFRVDFAYNAAGQFTSIKRYKDLDGGSGNLVVETSYAYDNIGRLTGLTHFKDTTTFADYEWDYDALSRVTDFTFSHLVGGSGTASYSYDNTSQVTGADHSNQTDETYSYDASGNRTISGYTTGDANRLTSDGVFNFTYDDEGNRIAMTRISSAQADDKTTEYTWDHRNRLTKVVEKNNAGTVTQSIDYVYDFFDRRIEKSFDADGAGGGTSVVTRWAYDAKPVYDGNGIALYNILLTVDATGLVTHRYLHGPAVDQVLADDYIGAEKFFPLADNLGTIRDVIDALAAVRNHVDYDSFGRVTNESTAAFDFLYGYTGRERDEETGMHHLRARIYDAVHSIFKSEDWVRGDLQNIYRYTGNNPTNATDPSGLDEVREDEVVVGPFKGWKHLYYEQWGEEYYIGIEDPASGVVYRTHTQGSDTSGTGTHHDQLTQGMAAKSYHSSRAEVEDEVSSFGTTDDWLAWFRKQRDSAFADTDNLGGAANQTGLYGDRMADEWYMVGEEYEQGVYAVATEYALAPVGATLVSPQVQASRMTRVKTAHAAPTLPNTTRGWKVGEPINNLTARGRVPSWDAVRQRFWKNEAHFHAAGYSEANLARMRTGLAPQRVNPHTGQLESMELHHTPPQRAGKLFDVRPMWPDTHDLVDPFRSTGN